MRWSTYAILFSLILCSFRHLVVIGRFVLNALLDEALHDGYAFAVGSIFFFPTLSVASRYLDKPYRTKAARRRARALHGAIHGQPSLAIRLLMDTLLAFNDWPARLRSCLSIAYSLTLGALVLPIFFGLAVGELICLCYD